MFNASELSQLSGAGKTLREEIIEILSAAKEPMSCHDIMQISKLSPDRETMTREVYAMKQAGLVEPAGSQTRPGLPRPAWLYSLPVAGVNHSQNSLQENVEEEQQVNTEQSAQSPKESKERPKVSSNDIRDLVILHPGIKREDVYKKLVFDDDSNKKKVGDLISYMINDGQLIQVEESGFKCLLPGRKIKENKQNPITPKEKGKLEAEINSRCGDDESIENNEESIVETEPTAPHVEVPLPMPSAFRCALFSDGVMVIDVPDHGSIQLTKDETMELFTYLDGIGSYAREELGL